MKDLVIILVSIILTIVSGVIFFRILKNPKVRRKLRVCEIIILDLIATIILIIRVNQGFIPDLNPVAKVCALVLVGMGPTGYMLVIGSLMHIKYEDWKFWQRDWVRKKEMKKLHKRMRKEIRDLNKLTNR